MSAVTLHRKGVALTMILAPSFTLSFSTARYRSEESAERM